MPVIHGKVEHCGSVEIVAEIESLSVFNLYVIHILNKLVCRTLRQGEFRLHSFKTKYFSVIRSEESFACVRV